MNEKEWGTAFKLIEIKNANDFDKLYLELQNNNEYYYRGHENPEWSLKSSFQRLCLSREKSGLPLPKEKEMINQFVKTVPSKVKDRKLWDIIGNMQHYGIPTRMLDFTENFIVSAYFAITESSFIESEGKFNSEVYAIDRRIINKNPEDIVIENLDDFSKPKEKDISYNIFLYKMSKPSKRVINQKGVFLFMHNPFIELANKISIENNWHVLKIEKMIYDMSEQWSRSTGLLLIKFSLTPEEFIKVRNIFKKLNIDSSFLFPDLHGKIKHISEIY